MDKQIILTLSSEEFDFLGLCLRTMNAYFMSGLCGVGGSIDFDSLNDTQKQYYHLYESLLPKF